MKEVVSVLRTKVLRKNTFFASLAIGMIVTILLSVTMIVTHLVTAISQS